MNLGIGNCKTRRGSFMFWDLVSLTLEDLREIVRVCDKLPRGRLWESSDIQWFIYKHEEQALDWTSTFCITVTS